MRLRTGQLAPLFDMRDVYGRRVSLAQYAGTRVLLAFGRSAACPLCDVRLRHLILRYPEYRRRGLEVIAFYESSPVYTHRYLDWLECPFPLIADRERRVYGLFQLETSWMGTALPLVSRLPVYLEARREKVGVWNPFLNFFLLDGNTFRMPADFLLDRDLRIQKAHYGRDAGDFLSFGEIDAFANGNQAGRATWPGAMR